MVSVQRHLQVLRGMLRPDEAERLWVRAERVPAGHAGALLVTDRRLLFSGLGFVQQSQEAWPLALVDGTDLVPGRRAVLEVRLPGGGERFSGRERDLQEVLELLAVRADPEPVPPSVAGGLERIAALHESGALTDEEFARAKARLLE